MTKIFQPDDAVTKQSNVALKIFRGQQRFTYGLNKAIGWIGS